MKIIQQGMLKQIGSLIVAHTTTAVIGTVVAFILMSALNGGVGDIIISVLFTAVYFSAIYSAAWRCAEYDKKSYTTTSVYMLKGAVLSVGIFALNVILYLAYIFAWGCLAMNGVVATATGMLYNILYVVNTFTYSGFFEISKGSVPLEAHLAIVLVPTAAAAIGYIAGVKGIALMDKLTVYMYDKK